MIDIVTNGTTRSVYPEDGSSRWTTFMGDDVLTLRFSLSYYANFEAGSSVLFAGLDWYSRLPAQVKKVNNRNFEYVIDFYSPVMWLSNWLLRDMDNWASFTFTGTVDEFVDLISQTIADSWRGYYIQIRKGVIEHVDEQKTITFDFKTYKEAIDAVAEAFEFEYRFEVVKNTTSQPLYYARLFMQKQVYDDNTENITLAYGKNNGVLSGMTVKSRRALPPMRQMYVQGSDRNLDIYGGGGYGMRHLHLPFHVGENNKYRVMHNNVTFVAEQGNAQGKGGRYIVLEGMTDKVFNREGSFTDNEIYPHFTHVATGSGYVDPGTAFFVIDERTSFNFNYHDYLIAGQNMKIVFQTGRCSGMEFDCNFDNALRKFTLVSREEDGYTYPNLTVRPIMGDKFIIANVALPQQYIKDNSNFTGAEWDLFRAAAKAFYDDIVDNTDVAIEIDPIWYDDNRDKLKLDERIRVGSVINVYDYDMIQGFNMQFRIESVKTRVNDTRFVKIEVKPFRKRDEFIICYVGN